MKYEKAQFVDQDVVLDGNEFHGCQFANCRLVFRGEGSVDLMDCSFKNPSWKFDGPAATTVKFLSCMYHGMGEAGMRCVEETFNQIRLNRINPTSE